MRLFLIDCTHSITTESLERGKDRGFDGLIHYVTGPDVQRRVDDCAALGLESILFLPDWARQGPPNWPDFPFRDAAGHESYRRGVAQENLFPSYWYKDPSIMQFVQARFDEAYDLGDRLDGAIISTSPVECKMPIRWLGDEDDEAMAKRFAFWCFDKYAIKAFRKYVANHVALPAAAPAWDTQLLTMRFCQNAMMDRLDDIARVTVEHTQQFWVFINTHMRSSGDLYKAAGYYFMDEPLEQWREAFIQREGVEPGFFIPSLYLASPQRRERIHELTDASGEYRWKFMAGLQCDMAGWRENILTNGEHAKQAGMSAMCAQWEPMTSPATEQVVREAVKFIKGE